jgi:hypothetical protein
LVLLILHILDEVGDVSRSQFQGNFQILPISYSFVDFISPFIFVCLAVSSTAGQSRGSFVSDLIEFYDSTFKGWAQPMINESTLLHFKTQLFSLSCLLNRWSVIETLIEHNWMPESLELQVREAVKSGHQKTLHVLLESLLAPDFQIETDAGVVPKIFLQENVLRSIPLIARKFPSEAEWLVEKLSYIPIPIAVPKNTDSEPSLKSRITHGMRLGSATLLDVCTQHSSSRSQSIWGKMAFSGPLRDSNRNHSKLQYENESVICMVPLALVDKAAFHEGSIVAKSNRYETNSLIRLLSTNNENIILSPMIQALMEFHWFISIISGFMAHFIPDFYSSFQ